MNKKDRLIWSYRIQALPTWLKRHRSHIAPEHYADFSKAVALYRTECRLYPTEEITVEDVMEYESIELFRDYNAQFLDWERSRLYINMNRPIVLIAFLDEHEQKTAGYKMIRSGVISDCLKSENRDVSWWLDQQDDLRGDVKDGILGDCYYLYRVVKADISPAQLKEFLEEIADGHICRSRIEAITESLGPAVRSGLKRPYFVHCKREGIL